MLVIPDSVSARVITDHREPQLEEVQLAAEKLKVAPKTTCVSAHVNVLCSSS